MSSNYNDDFVWPDEEGLDVQNDVENKKDKNDIVLNFFESEEIQSVLDTVNLKDASEIGFYVMGPNGEPVLMRAERESLAQNILKIAGMLNKEAEKGTRLPKDKKKLLLAVDRFKVKLLRKFSSHMARGEDWPVTILMTLLYSDKTAVAMLNAIKTDSGEQLINGYEKFSMLTGKTINTVSDIVQTFISNFSGPGLAEDTMDAIMALFLNALKTNK